MAVASDLGKRYTIDAVSIGEDKVCHEIADKQATLQKCPGDVVIVVQDKILDKGKIFVDEKNPIVT